MALQKSYTAATGQVHSAAYWHIDTVTFQHNLNVEKVNIVVLIYADIAAKDADKEPVGRTSATFTTTVHPDTNDTYDDIVSNSVPGTDSTDGCRKALYNFLKDLPELSGYTDVFSPH